MSDDDDVRKLVLARRARFVAAAVAGVGIACGKAEPPPAPCLSIAMQRVDADVPDAGDPTSLGTAADAATDANGPDAAAPDAATELRVPPTPCLSVVAPPPTKPQPPMPCLKVKPPTPTKK